MVSCRPGDDKKCVWDESRTESFCSQEHEELNGELQFNVTTQ